MPTLLKQYAMSLTTSLRSTTMFDCTRHWVICRPMPMNLNRQPNPLSTCPKKVDHYNPPLVPKGFASRQRGGNFCYQLLRFGHADFGQHVFEDFILRLQAFPEAGAVLVIVFPLILLHRLAPRVGFHHATEDAVPIAHLIGRETFRPHHAARQIEHDVVSLFLERRHAREQAARAARRTEPENANLLRFEQRQEIAGRYRDDVDVAAEQRGYCVA